MTSSLVGSEMCIRDRGDAAHQESLEATPATCDCLHDPSHIDFDPSAALPVSYTHLTLPTICSV
eukprot:4750937-Prorocentrum_lima.AAC.1